MALEVCYFHRGCDAHFEKSFRRDVGQYPKEAKSGTIQLLICFSDPFYTFIHSGRLPDPVSFEEVSKESVLAFAFLAFVGSRRPESRPGT